MSAVPMYLSISDIGFGTVAGNDMAIRVSSGDRAGALETFQSTWAMVAALSLAIAAAAFCCILFLPITSWLKIRMVPAAQGRLILAALSVYSLGVLQASTLLSGFRSDGKYPLGAFAINLIRLAENAAVLATLILHGGPVRVAVVMAATRLVGTLAVATSLTASLRWIRFGYSHATWQRIKDLAQPAFAFMAFPTGNALSIQGMTILIGIALGPLAVATFTPMRTLSRFPYQVIDSIKNAVWPELSSAYGAQRWELARKLHRSCCQIAFWFAVVAVIALAIGGPACFHIWTRGQVVMNQNCFDVLLLVVVASSLWNTSSAVSVAANRHQQLAVQYLLGTAGSLVLAYVFVPRFGLTGAAVALLACDLWMGSFVVSASNKLLGDHTPDFVRSMMQVQRVLQLWGR